MKFLLSPGFGAGWSSWNRSNKKVFRYMLTYQPIIDYLENGGNASDLDAEHPLIKQLEKECKDKFNEDYICILGADDLIVCEENSPFKINEYDGSESYSLRDEIDWIEGD